MDKWKSDFLYKLTTGREVVEAARLVGHGVAEIYNEYNEDPLFAQEWDRVSPDTVCAQAAPMMLSREINAATLERMLRAQVEDDELAAYFGMELEAFRGVLAADADLSRVYNLGRKAGLAELKLAQWEGAMDGNAGMQTWLGKNALGQSDKVESKVSSEVSVDVDPEELARRLMSLVDGGGALPDLIGVIDLEEIDDGE